MKVNFNSALQICAADSIAANKLSTDNVALIETPKREINNYGMDTDNVYPTELSFCDTLCNKIIGNVAILSSLGGGTLCTLASSASKQALTITQNVKCEIYGYFAQINCLLCNPYMSEQDIKNQIELILKKIKALSLEACSKVMNLYAISEVVKSLYSIFFALKEAGIDTTETTNMFKVILNNIELKPSNLSDICNTDDIYKVIDKNKKTRFGANAKEKFLKFIHNTEEKFKKNEDKLLDKSLSKDEIKKLKLQNIYYSVVIRFFKSFAT